MFQYWKVRMEYYINKITSASSKKILLVGYLSFFKNHKIYLNLSIITKFFLKVNYIYHAQSIIKHNLENSKTDIIEGNFDLNYLDSNFLIKKRMQLQTIYTKINYIVMSLPSIVNTIELNFQSSIPDILYYASFYKYEKKIPIICNSIQAYNKEWLALSNILNTLDAFNKKENENENNNKNLEKGVKGDKTFIKMSKEQSKYMNKLGYIYEIIHTENFLPFPSKHNIYKYLLQFSGQG
jgi:hypothetical protein